MANHISHASLPFPVKQARFTILVPYLDSDGDPTDPTTPDTEVSQDGGAFADAAEEVTTITGSNGLGYITLTGAEMNNSAVGVAFKVASGPKATLMTLFPRVLPVEHSGTAQAGAAGTITLASGASAIDDYYNGCIVRTTGGTGGGGTGGANNQARVITDYVGSTKVATVVPNWETTPDSTTTYEVQITDMAVNVMRALRPTVDQRTLDVASTGEAGVDFSNINGTLDAAEIGSGAITAAKFATGAIDAAAIADGAIDAATFAAGAINAAAIAADAIGASELAADAATEIAAAVWDKATASHVTSGSFGQILGGIRSGTAQAGAATTITLDASASAVDDFYNNDLIYITGGTGVGQARFVTDYVGATKVATVATWVTNPDATSVFVIIPFGAIPGATAPTAAEVADAVWDEAMSGHVAAGSYGLAVQPIRANVAQAGAAGTITLDASASATDDLYNGCWIALVNDTGAGQARLITDYVGSTKVATISPNWVTNPASGTEFVIVPAARVDLALWLGSAPNALVSGRVDTTVGAMQADVVTASAIATDAIGSAELAASAVTEIQTGLSTLDAAGVRTAVGLAAANLDTQLSGIQADTDNIQTRIPAALVSGRMDSSVGAVATGAITAAGFAAGAIDAAAIATGAVDADALAADAVTEIWAKALADLSAIPGATASVLDGINFMFMLARNLITQTATTQTLKKDDGTTTVGTSTHSDDGSVHTRGKWT